MAAAPEASPGEDLEFDWKEVNCFLRPQAVLCEELGAGYGLLFLCLTSFHRAWGFDRFFTEPGRQHFAFARHVVSPLSGIEFDVWRLDDRAGIPDALERALARGAAAIVPANVRHLGRPQPKDGDQQHYFIVTALDRAGRSVTVRDNLHLETESPSTRYAPHALPLHVFYEAARLYWETHVDSGRDTPSGEPSFWILQIRGDGRPPPPEIEVLRLLVATCERLLREPEGAPGGCSPFDGRYLASLRLSSGGEDRDKRMMAYLSEANLALVGPRILSHALRRLGRGGAADRLDGAVEAYRVRSNAERIRALVQLKSGKGLSEEGAARASGALDTLAAGLLRAAAAALGEPAGEVGS